MISMKDILVNEMETFFREILIVRFWEWQDKRR